ncbi:uncharacterized protein N7483_010167 [Penicillium malachiteum]|uniref:uncharacterized protein n=1 Tax=Penicillium malachiteum TaxID=1324776 RepID=UPI00254815A4|nr:uncharacterized protein N7483_010167 [Penicillium malachiteum]KAJ5712986.1 hypothetical protein N7483_010167 [Penicillium malachiteum]
MSTIGVKRACDQCHAVKEKCRRETPTVPCERCARLGQSCRTIRSPGKAGRKPQGARKLSYTLPSTPISAAGDMLNESPGYSSPTSTLLYNAGLSSNPAIFSDLDEWEQYFLDFMRDIIAPSPLDKFLVGPSFHDSHHTSFVQNLIQPIPELKNASVACAAVLFGDLFTEHTNTTVDIGHKRAALAVSSLRSFRISDEKDLMTMLVLTVAMITFAMHVEDGQPYLIARYTLSLIEAQYQHLIRFESPMMGLLMCLISTDTFECLLRSEVPAWRINTTERENVVDRYLGLSYPLFPLLYDICEVADQLQHCKNEERAEIAGRLTAINTTVDNWHPSPPVDLVQCFTQAEVIIISAQAKILRLTGLLIIHRLKHPFGQHDDEGQVLSRAIIFEFDTVLQLTNRSVPCTSLAYLTACFEISGEDGRETALIRSANVVTFSKQALVKLNASLVSIWRARDQGSQFYWTELAKYL